MGNSVPARKREIHTRAVRLRPERPRTLHPIPQSLLAHSITMYRLTEVIEDDGRAL